MEPSEEPEVAQPPCAPDDATPAESVSKKEYPSPEPLIAETDAAFPPEAPPQSSVAPEQYPGEGPVEVLQGRTRESLSDEDVLKAIGYSNLHLLSPSAVRYYWPRLVRFATKDDSEQPWNLRMHMLDVLSVADNEYTAGQFSEFTVEQRRAVCSFVRFGKAATSEVDFSVYGDEINRAEQIWCGDGTPVPKARDGWEELGCLGRCILVALFVLTVPIVVVGVPVVVLLGMVVWLFERIPGRQRPS